MELFDLKSFRENSLKMTQNELANLLGMRQDTISRLEKNPDQISLADLQKLAEKTGMTLDQLVSYKKPVPKALVVEPTWNKAKYMKATLANYIANFSKSFRDATGTTFAKSVTELQKNIDCTIRKPKIVFVGHSDSGKSTMINALIGREKLPTNWTPTTSIIVYIKHVEERPAFMDEELWIFKKGETDDGWDDTRLNDEMYCRKWKIAGGSAEMLSSYGTRHGDEYRADQIGSAVLFVDSDVLKNCDLLDVPGFTGGVESDNKTADSAKKKADVLVFLSQCSGFMNSNEDFVYLKDALSTLSVVEKSENDAVPLLGNLFVVGTQAHAVNHGNMSSINDILDDGCNRLYDTIPLKFWGDRGNISGVVYTQSDFRARFFSYSTDIKETRASFEDSLRYIVELMPSLIMEHAKTVVKKYCETVGASVDDEIAKYQGLIDQREQYEQLLQSIDMNEPKRQVMLREQQQQVQAVLRNCNIASRERFAKEFDSILQENHIVNIISDKDFSSKKEDMQRLGSYISSELEDAIKSVLESESKIYCGQVEKFISSFDGNCKVASVKFAGIDMADFNAKRAFASGLAGAATFGGLALWASTMGNLGAYILIAKGVSLLSAIGISVGGTAAATAAIASIGGPIVLGIALATIAAFGVFGFVSGNWKKKAAKKIIEAYKDKNALSQYNTAIDHFWEDTDKAFHTAAKGMEEEWEKYVSDLRDKTQNYDTNMLEKCIAKGKEVKTFFENIPL